MENSPNIPDNINWNTQCSLQTALASRDHALINARTHESLCTAKLHVLSQKYNWSNNVDAL